MTNINLRSGEVYKTNSIHGLEICKKDQFLNAVYNSKKEHPFCALAQ